MLIIKNMKNILVLGSSGQIGSYLVKYFKIKKYSISEFDIVRNPKEDLRIYSNNLLKKKIIKADYVFFLAFDVGGSRYLKKYQESYPFIKNNLQLMLATFEMLKIYKKKFLFASSQMSNMQYSNYGVLKFLGEKFSKLSNGLVVKFWNVYGIEKDINKSHVITDFILMALKNKKIKMLTDGSESRDFLYVDDCCSALDIVMKNHDKFKKKNLTIDIASGKKIKIFTVAKIIKNIFKKININIHIKKSKNKDLVQQNKKNKVNDFFFQFWHPKISIYNGIENIIKHYIKTK